MPYEQTLRADLTMGAVALAAATLDLVTGYYRDAFGIDLLDMDADIVTRERPDQVSNMKTRRPRRFLRRSSCDTPARCGIPARAKLAKLRRRSRR